MNKETKIWFGWTPETLRVKEELEKLKQEREEAFLLDLIGVDIQSSN